MTIFTRTEMLIGAQGLDTLKQSHVAVFGIGGVGSYAAEALARAGIGTLSIIDYDSVDVTNINRQIIALHSTIGRQKVDVMRDRILDINPGCTVHAHNRLFNRDSSPLLMSEDYDYIVDAIDMVSAKIHLIEQSLIPGIPIISSMGTGNKLDPARLEIDDISNTSVCPLARVMRKELKKREITSLKVLYSKEEPVKPVALPNNETVHKKNGTNTEGDENLHRKSAPPGSISFVPSAAGLIIASEVIRDLLQ